jgi:hypothetical protein
MKVQQDYTFLTTISILARCMPEGTFLVNIPGGAQSVGEAIANNAPGLTSSKEIAWDHRSGLTVSVLASRTSQLNESVLHGSSLQAVRLNSLRAKIFASVFPTLFTSLGKMIADRTR